jgi:hypothetical protein
MIFNRDYKMIMKEGKRILHANTPDTIEDTQKPFRLIFYVACLLVIIYLMFMTGCAQAQSIVDISTIAIIESSGHPSAFNSHSGAVGLCQITKPVLIEYNRHWETSWHMRDLFNPDLNIMVSTWYFDDRIPQLLKHYHIKDTVRNRIWAYNAGIGMVKRGIMPLETRNYMQKYNKLRGEL